MPETLQVDERFVRVRDWGRTRYDETWSAMQAFTTERTEYTPDELWLTEHDPVFTQGQAGKPEHVLSSSEIPVVQTDRGGQVTYHGPGQIMGYLLCDLKRLGLSVHEFVRTLEQSMIDTLAAFDIEAHRREGWPGVYVANAKIGALGLRVRRGCTYHGLCLNVDMDLAPFRDINPCGLAGLAVTQIVNEVGSTDFESVKRRLLVALAKHYRFTLQRHTSDKPDSSAA